MGRKREPLTPEGQRIYARLTAHVSRELALALAQESALGQMTRAELARRLGRDKAFVTRKLSGGENMELRTVAAFLAALGYEMDVKAKRLAPLPKDARNFFLQSPSGATTVTIQNGSLKQLPSAAATVTTSFEASFSHAA